MPGSAEVHHCNVAWAVLELRAPARIASPFPGTTCHACLIQAMAAVARVSQPVPACTHAHPDRLPRYFQAAHRLSVCEQTPRVGNPCNYADGAQGREEGPDPMPHFSQTTMPTHSNAKERSRNRREPAAPSRSIC